METNLNELEKAMLRPFLPVNPLPFLIGLIDGVTAYGTDWINSDQARRILYVILTQAYGQSFNINCVDEFSLLSRID